MKPDQIIKFLEDFRLLHAGKGDTRNKPLTKLISMKVEKPLLEIFKKKCELLGTPYQTQIKRIMREWIKK